MNTQAPKDVAVAATTKSQGPSVRPAMKNVPAVFARAAASAPKKNSSPNRAP